MAHANEEIVRRGFEAFGAGDTDTLRTLFAPDLTWHTPGRNPLAGNYKGVEEVLGFFGTTMQRSGGTFRTEIHDIVGNDEHVFAAYVSTGEREGRTLRDGSVLLFHLRGGKVTEVWALAGDQYAVDEFWS